MSKRLLVIVLLISASVFVLPKDANAAMNESDRAAVASVQQQAIDASTAARNAATAAYNAAAAAQAAARIAITTTNDAIRRETATSGPAATQAAAVATQAADAANTAATNAGVIATAAATLLNSPDPDNTQVAGLISTAPAVIQATNNAAQAANTATAAALAAAATVNADIARADIASAPYFCCNTANPAGNILSPFVGQAACTAGCTGSTQRCVAGSSASVCPTPPGAPPPPPPGTPGATGTGTTGSGSGAASSGPFQPTRVSLPNPLGTTNLTVLIGRVIAALMSIVGSLALLMFIYGGFLWMTARGNGDDVKKGKSIIVWSVAGLLLIFSAYIILKFIFGRITGAITGT